MKGLLKSTPVQPSGGVLVIAIISSPVPRLSTSIFTDTGTPTVASTVLSASATDKSIQYSWFTIVIILTVLLAYFGGFSFCASSDDAVKLIVNALLSSPDLIETFNETNFSPPASTSSTWKDTGSTDQPVG